MQDAGVARVIENNGGDFCPLARRRRGAVGAGRVNMLKLKS